MRGCVAICGLVAIGLAEPVLAGDLGEPYLRGSIYEPSAATYHRWSGVYFGGQAGYSSGKADFSAPITIADLADSTLRSTGNDISAWASLGRSGAASVGYGGFIGYNGQWEDAILGVELNYSRSNLSSSVFSTNPLWTTDIVNASVHLTDFGTLRLRGGWAANAFMPYGFVAVAAGRADVLRSAVVTDSFGTVQAIRDDKFGVYSFGYAVGAGIDISLISCLFLRGEYEFARFGSFEGINLNINTVRAAVGIKF